MQMRCPVRLRSGEPCFNPIMINEDVFTAPIDMEAGDRVDLDLQQLIYSRHRVKKIVRGRRIIYRNPSDIVSMEHTVPRFAMEYPLDSPTFIP